MNPMVIGHLLPKKKVRQVLLVMATLAVIGFSGAVMLHAEPWDKTNNPLNLSGTLEMDFTKLPPTGVLSEVPWSGPGWASNEGGISAAQNVYSRNFWYLNFQNRSPSLDTLQNMPPSQIAALSPAEKYDIYNRQYTYPTVESENNRTSPYAQSWEGLCHGWAAASIHFKEPKSITVTNEDGITIPFSSRDIKGLLTYYEGVVMNKNVKILGNRNNERSYWNTYSRNSLAARDTNPGAFHIILSNFISLKRQPFIADLSQDEQVWNYPIYGYQSKVTRSTGRIPRNAAPGTTKVITLSTQIQYRAGNETVHDFIGVGGYSKTARYEYQLELDHQNQILGGTWLSKTHPDFLWTKAKPLFSDKFKAIETLYQKSLQ